MACQKSVCDVCSGVRIRSHLFLHYIVTETCPHPKPKYNFKVFVQTLQEPSDYYIILRLEQNWQWSELFTLLTGWGLCFVSFCFLNSAGREWRSVCAGWETVQQCEDRTGWKGKGARHFLSETPGGAVRLSSSRQHHQTAGGSCAKVCTDTHTHTFWIEESGNMFPLLLHISVLHISMFE